VLRMFQTLLGEKGFQSAVRFYLRRNQFVNADAQSLLDALTDVRPFFCDPPPLQPPIPGHASTEPLEWPGRPRPLPLLLRLRPRALSTQHHRGDHTHSLHPVTVGAGIQVQRAHLVSAHPTPLPCPWPRPDCVARLT